MAIAKWDPLDDVASFQRRINKMFEDTFLGKRALKGLLIPFPLK